MVIIAYCRGVESEGDSSTGKMLIKHEPHWSGGHNGHQQARRKRSTVGAVRPMGSEARGKCMLNILTLCTVKC